MARHARRRRNPDRRLVGWGIAGGLALLTLGTAGVAVARTHQNPPARRARLQALANVWGPRFGVAPATMMAIGKIESGWMPDTVNYEPRVILLGGAWGPWQMTRRTGSGMAKLAARHKDPAVRAVAARWKGDGRALLTDLELAAMLTAAFLGDLARQFGHDFKLVAAAYHQGAGKIRQMLRDKLPIPERLPPNGKLYVTRAIAARRAVA